MTVAPFLLRARGGHRRAPSGAQRALPFALGSAVIALALAGPALLGGWSPARQDDHRTQVTLTALPADAPELGLVYEGLEPAPKGALCAGSYELVTPETCTHGPDPAPAGLKVSRDVPPVSGPAPAPTSPIRESGRPPSDADIVRDEGGEALAAGAPALVPDAAPGEADFVMGDHRVACEADGRAGKRVQVLYLHDFGTPSRYSEYLSSIQDWSAGVDTIVDASAGDTGGSRHVRFVTTPQCEVDVAEVQVPAGTLDSFTGNINELRRLGYNRTDRKYLIFADTNTYCGIGTFIADLRPGLGNRNNGGPSYGRIDAGCWSAAVATTELTYTLGAVLAGSPTADYFHTDSRSGSSPAKTWNVAQSAFLLKTDGGDDVPGAPARATSPATTDPTTSATPSVTPSTGDASASGTPSSGSPTASAGPPSAEETPPSTPPTSPEVSGPPPAEAAPNQAVLEVRDPTSTAVRLIWSAAGGDATYEVAVDGVTIATTRATRARLIGLRPDTTYQVTVRNAAQQYTATGAAVTVPAARPAQDSWFVLANSLTGGAADLYAARAATGTPVVLNGAEGGTQQQWKLVPDGRGSFWLKSRATGKCVVAQGGNPVSGAPLVQTDCATQENQRWSLRLTDHGFSLNTTVGDLVIGVGGQRFGAHRLLVLQQADQSRHQSWTALPG